MAASRSNWIKLNKILQIYKTMVSSQQTVLFSKQVLGLTPFGIAVVKCHENFKLESLNQESLTHEQCIKQACLLSVNSATTLLTTTTSALLDTCRTYQESLNRILFLLESVQSNGDDNPELWDTIVEARMDVNKAKSSFDKIYSYMDTVEKVINSTTEAAFLAGSEYMCTSLCERLYSAQQEISSQILEVKKLEEDYLKLQLDISSSDNKNNKKLKNKEVKVVKNKDSNLLQL